MNRCIGVIGGGAWGSALAVRLAHNGHRVLQWIREADLVERMRRRRDNPVYLPGVPIPEGVEPIERVAGALSGIDLVVGAVPAQFARAVYREMAGHLDEGVPLLVVTKGIEQQTLALPLQVAAEELGLDRPVAVLSGPSFAAEVARGLATVVVVASRDPALARQVQRTFSSSALRLYTNADPVGVQLAGALKNVIAISTGMADSLTTGSNVRAALITRGLAEITRLGLSLGGRATTFAGLAGLGDLVLTCTGDQSRNRQVGLRLGRGERLAEIVAASRAVAEGIETTASARQLGRRQGVELPIVEEVYRILFEDGSPRDSLARLMSRPLTSEERPGQSMIDLHTHILPGVDDGVVSEDEAVEFARIAVGDGVRVCVATPHCKEGFYFNDRATVLAGVERLTRRLREERIDLQVEPGAEVHICPDLVERVRDGRAPTLGDNGKTLLLELSLTQYPVELENLIFQLKLAGLEVLLAHPERIRFFQDDVARLEAVIHLGAYGQVTTGSILGLFGRAAQTCSEELLRRELVHVLASDAHGTGGRPPVLSAAIEAMIPLVGERRARCMAQEAPAALLEGREPELPALARRAPRRRFAWPKWLPGR